MDDVVVFRRTRGWRMAHVALVGFGVLALAMLITRQFAAWVYARGVNPWWLFLAIVVAAIPLARIALRRIAARIELRAHSIQLVEGDVRVQSLSWAGIERIRYGSGYLDLNDETGKTLRVDKRFEQYPSLVNAILRMTGSARAARSDVPAKSLPAVFRRSARLYIAIFLTALLSLTVGAFLHVKIFVAGVAGLALLAVGVMRSPHRIVIDRGSIHIVRPFSSIVVPLLKVQQVYMAAATSWSNEVRPFVALQTGSDDGFILEPVDTEMIDLFDHVNHARAVAVRASAMGHTSAPSAESPPRLAFAAAGLLVLAYVAVLPIASGAGLRHAAQRGDTAGVERMLRFHVPVDVRGWSGKTALYEAAKYGRDDVVEILLAAGAAVDAPSRSTGLTPLHVAAEYNNVAILRRLLEAGGSINQRSRHSFTPLAQISWKADPHSVAVAEVLLDNGADINAATKVGYAPLHHATMASDLALIRYLVARGAPLELRTTSDGYTPLMLAALEGRLEVAETLIELGAAIEARSEDGSTPLYMAAATGHSALVARLIALGARVAVETRRGWTPTQVAAWNGNAEVLRSLLAGGADPNGSTATVGPPLHIAAREGHVSAVSVLLAAGADPDGVHEGKRAIDAARERAHASVVQVFERRPPAGQAP